jgi:twinkle protein
MTILSAYVRGLSVRATERTACPMCSNDRKKTIQKDFVITCMDDGWLYHCHHCGVSGNVNFKKTDAITIRKPSMNNVTALKTNESFLPLSDKHYAYLDARGISKVTADTHKLFSATKYFSRNKQESDAIGFPYYKGGVLVSNKYRSLADKDFTQDAGGAHDFWNIDNVLPDLPIIIVEGEIDALTAAECGLINVVSVPSGAPMKVSDGKIHPSEDKKFEFVWNANAVINAAPYIIIATDSDSPGQALAEELSRRIGKHKCRLVKFNTHKDLNEVFLSDGTAAVVDLINSAEPYPVEGLSSADKFEARLNDLWTKGTGSGYSTGYASVDQIYTVSPGQVTVVTGYPSHGKSNFIDQICVNLAKKDDWKIALCSFENVPEIHISRLMEIYERKRFFDGTRRMSEEERARAYEWVKEHFLFMDSETVEPATVDSILDRAMAAVSRMGIRGLVIDPYNYIDVRSNGDSETAAISNMLTRVQSFAKAYGVHVWFIAHPAKIMRSGIDLPRPDGMSISGSMAWWAKADCGITVHRSKTNVEIAVWKCRYRWVGTQGETALAYDKTSGSYEELKDNF